VEKGKKRWFGVPMGYCRGEGLLSKGNDNLGSPFLEILLKIVFEND
jgi:hypothetical protein